MVKRKILFKNLRQIWRLICWPSSLLTDMCPRMSSCTNVCIPWTFETAFKLIILLFKYNLRLNDFSFCFKLSSWSVGIIKIQLSLIYIHHQRKLLPPPIPSPKNIYNWQEGKYFIIIFQLFPLSFDEILFFMEFINNTLTLAQIPR